MGILFYSLLSDVAATAECFHRRQPKERYKSVTDPLIIPHRSRLSSAELLVLGGP
jgi:hypothetical protein